MARADHVPLMQVGGLVGVRARLNGQRDYLLVVDTGAERILISPAIAERLALDLSHPVRRERLMGVGQSGPVPVVRLESVAIGGSMVRNLEAAVMDLPPVIPADGLLGLSFLARFRVTFEFNKKTLVIRNL